MTTASLPVPSAAGRADPDPRPGGREEHLGPDAGAALPASPASPSSSSDVTIQPVIFVLLFTYVFGSAIHLPGGGDYHQYLISGMFGMAMAGSAPGTAVGLTTDMSTGLIDRFRSLPISRSAVLAGRTLSDLCTQMLGDHRAGGHRAGRRLADPTGSATRSRPSGCPCCSRSR